MSTLYLIRHGQASFGTDDYDRLSDLGRLQATRTGEFLRRSGIFLDAIYSGSLKRQIDTAALVLGEQDYDVQPIADARFDEIRNDEQFEKLGPYLAESDPALAALLAASHNDSKSYQKVLSVIFEYWVDNDCGEFGIQTWADFSGGVHDALYELIHREGSGRNVALFSSGGTIATIVTMVLGLKGTSAYRFYEPIHNCAITRLMFSGDRISLASFNDTSFLHALGAEYGEKLVTYR